MPGRSANDGKPFFCLRCGAGWFEFNGCERIDCELESDASAKGRQERGFARQESRILKQERKQRS